MKGHFLLNILLAMVWSLLTGDLGVANFVFGFILGFLIVWMISLESKDTKYIHFVPNVIGFIFFFIYQLIKANLEVAYEVATPNMRMKPGIVQVPLDAKTDLEITFLANVLALTPGSLSLDVSDDKKYLYVHAIYVKDKEKYINNIKNGFEKRILNILR